MAEAVAEVAFGGRALPEVARTIDAGATSIRRWLAWLIGLAKPQQLIAVTARLDPDAPPGAGVPAMAGVAPARRRAAQALAPLEHLGLALLRRGVTLAERTGLGRVLGWQRPAARRRVRAGGRRPHARLPGDGSRGVLGRPVAAPVHE